MTFSAEMPNPFENRKYRICYFCAEDLNDDQHFLECGHQFCHRCLANLPGCSKINQDGEDSTETNNSYLRLQKLFRVANAAAKSQSSNQLNSIEMPRKYSESQLANMLLHSKVDIMKCMDNNMHEEMIKCPVCRKICSSNSHRQAPAGDFQSVNDLTEERLIIRCDCCIHKGKHNDDQIIEAEFFCQKCSLNFCHKCRTVHDETPLFQEHPVLPVTGKTGGVERLCRRHNNLLCSYFCITCKMHLCSLCVLYHNSSNIKTSATKTLKSIHDFNSIHKSMSDHHNEKDRRLETRELENYTILRSVVSDDTFQCTPNHIEEVNGHKIIKFREALTMAREELKSSLNQLGPRLDMLKEKLRSFCFTSTEETPSPFSSDAVASSSSSSSTLSPPPNETVEIVGEIKKQHSFTKRHFSTEKNVMSRLLRSKTSDKDKDTEVRLGRFRLSRSKKLSVGRCVTNNATPQIKLELSSPTDINSDGSEGNSWSSDASTNHLKLFRNFRKKFQSSTSKNSPVCTERKSNDSEVRHSFSVSQGNSVKHGKKQILRKLSSSSAACQETLVGLDSLNEQEHEFIKSSKILISKYLKLFDVSSKALESSHSKKLYEVYKNLTSRVKVILEEELTILEPEISKRTTQRRDRLRVTGNRSSENLKRFVCRNDPSVATLAITSAGLLESLSGLALSPLSQKLKIQGEEPTEIWSSRRTILARPFQRWKYERTKTDLETSPVPCSAVLVDEGRIAVVAEYDNNNFRNNRLQILDGLNGNYIESVLEGQIQPLGMAVNREQNIVVTDCKGKRVKIISLETKTTIAEMGKGMFGWPCGVAVNSRGQIVVSDVFNDCIFVFSPDGKKLKTFGSSGRHQEQLRNPYHLAVDSRDRIYVSDSSNGCVKVFDTSGNLFFTSMEIVRHYSVIQDACSERKTMSRKLRDPRGVAVDEFGNFFVADECSRVCMFNSFGKFNRYLLTEEDSLKSPEGLNYCQTRDDGLLLLTEWTPSNLYSVKLFSLYQNM